MSILTDTKTGAEVSLWTLAITALLIVPITIWEAYVLIVIWGWYAPEVWGALTLRTAVGVIIVVALFKPPPAVRTEPVELVLRSMIGPTAVLGLAWVFRQILIILETS